MTSHRLFLDANVLFSAAYRPDGGVRRLWLVPGVELVTSDYAIDEARRNLPVVEQRVRLDELLARVTRVPTAVMLPRDLAGIDLPGKDRPILGSALHCGATHLITGDSRHFGPHFGVRVHGLLILPPAMYLREVEPQLPR